MSVSLVIQANPAGPLIDGSALSAVRAKLSVDNYARELSAHQAASVQHSMQTSYVPEKIAQLDRIMKRVGPDGKENLIRKQQGKDLLIVSPFLFLLTCDLITALQTFQAMSGNWAPNAAGPSASAEIERYGGGKAL